MSNEPTDKDKAIWHSAEACKCLGNGDTFTAQRHLSESVRLAITAGIVTPQSEIQLAGERVSIQYTVGGDAKNLALDETVSG